MKILKVILVLFFSTFFNQIFAQKDTLFYNEDRQRVYSFGECAYYGFLTPIENGKFNYDSYFSTGDKRSSLTYVDTIDYELDGKATYWYKSGVMRKTVEYIDKKLNGSLIVYWENGKNKRHDLFDQGEFVSGMVWDESGKKLDYFPAYSKAEFAGGIESFNKFLIKNLKYPSYERKKGIEGQVVLGFFIEKDGTISNIKVLNSVSEGLYMEAIRVLKMSPNWIPGKDEGDAIRTSFRLPIRFRLD